MERNVSNLIKEECASVCLFKFAYVVGMGIGKGPFHVAEEFAFKKCLCKCPHIYTYHRPPHTAAQAVNLPRQHVLSGSVFSGNEHCGICRGYLLHAPAYLLHLRGCAPEHFVGKNGFLLRICTGLLLLFLHCI